MLKCPDQRDHGDGKGRAWPGYSGTTTVEWTFRSIPDGTTFVRVQESGWTGDADKLVRYVADSTQGFARLVARATGAAARVFLNELVAVVPYRIHTILTDNGIQFVDLPKNRSGPTARWRGHPFDRTCQSHGIEHRLTKPNHPWTNGQVERMNRTIKEATVKRYHYDSHDQLPTVAVVWWAIAVALDLGGPEGLRAGIRERLGAGGRRNSMKAASDRRDRAMQRHRDLISERETVKALHGACGALLSQKHAEAQEGGSGRLAGDNHQPVPLDVEVPDKADACRAVVAEVTGGIAQHNAERAEVKDAWPPAAYAVDSARLLMAPMSCTGS